MMCCWTPRTQGLEYSKALKEEMARRSEHLHFWRADWTDLVGIALLRAGKQADYQLEWCVNDAGFDFYKEYLMKVWAIKAGIPQSTIEDEQNSDKEYRVNATYRLAQEAGYV